MDTLTFTDMIAKSYAYNPQTYGSSEAWRTVKELYLLNESDGVERIPRKIHQIWLGGSVPMEYRRYMGSWLKKHPMWQYYFWTDSNINTLQITSSEAFKRAINPAMKSDIIRYEVLRKYGGVYVDTDFECLRPFDDLLHLNFFTGISYDSSLQLYNGLIACVPNHPIIEACTRIDGFYDGHKGSRIIELTGANHFTKCFLKNITSGTVAFPMDYFYPYPNNIRGSGDPYKYVTDKSYAIHHWAVSWTKSKRRNGSRL